MSTEELRGQLNELISETETEGHLYEIGRAVATGEAADMGNRTHGPESLETLAAGIASAVELADTLSLRLDTDASESERETSRLIGFADTTESLSSKAAAIAAGTNNTEAEAMTGHYQAAAEKAVRVRRLHSAANSAVGEAFVGMHEIIEGLKQALEQLAAVREKVAEAKEGFEQTDEREGEVVDLLAAAQASAQTYHDAL
jgi:hypothetical protein